MRTIFHGIVQKIEHDLAKSIGLNRNFDPFCAPGLESHRVNLGERCKGCNDVVEIRSELHSAHSRCKRAHRAAFDTRELKDVADQRRQPRHLPLHVVEYPLTLGVRSKAPETQCLEKELDLSQRCTELMGYARD